MTHILDQIRVFTPLLGQAALEKYAASPEGAEFSEFYQAKIKGNGAIQKIYKGETANTEFFATSTAHWNAIVEYLTKDLPAILPDSGFIGGSEPGEDDFHVGAWLARVAWVSGADKDSEGYKALEKEVGGPVHPKIVAYWKAWSARPSWQKVYAETLH